MICATGFIRLELTGLTPSVRLFIWTFSLSVDFVCFELHVVMMRSMRSVFWEHQLLYCQTIEQCLMLHEDVCKQEWVRHLRTKGQAEGVENRYFADILYGRSLTDPRNAYELIL